MKKVYLMKGMAAMTLGLVVASCNKADFFNAYADQEVKEQEFTENFQNSVMGGKTIDPNQNWSTAVQSTVSISVNLDYDAEYTIFLFSDDPNTNANAKYLGVAKVKSGASTSISFAKPADVTALYVACVDKKGNYFAQRFAIEGTTASVNIGNTAKNAVARRAATTVNGVDVNPDSYKRDKTEFIDNLKDYDNNWASYYDMSQVDANDNLNKILYWPVPGNAYGDNKHFILHEGAEFTLTSKNMQNAWNDMVIVVRGTLTISADFDNSECRLYEKQTIVIDGGTVICDAPKLTCANSSNIINIGGSFQLNGTYFDYANGGEKGFANFGTIVGTKGAGINFAGGTPYYNAGSIDFTDNGFIKFNGDIVYVNVGHIHAYSADNTTKTLDDNVIYGELARGGQNAKVVNLCDMTFDKFFSVHTYIGTSNSLLYAKEGLLSNNQGNITLGSQAMIKCGDWFDNGAKVAASAVADEYAVFQITGDVHEVNGGMTGATGYAYFDITGEIKGPNGDTTWHPGQFKNNMLTYTVSEATAPANITIAKDEDGCNYIGYHEGEGNKTFDPNYIYYAFEDLGTTDDFDFNDVVIRVSAPNANGVATVELVAAGGTLPTVVTYGEEALGSEVHQTFGVEVGTMVNTGAEKKEFKTLGTIEGLTAQTDMAQLPFGITVTGNGGQVTRVVNSVENKGKAPLMIVVCGNEEGKWFWATERTNITAAYAQFGEWGANAGTNTDWYKNATEGKVWKW